MRLLEIFAGAGLTIASSYAAGCLIAPRTAIPHVLRFATGAILYSACVFSLLTCGIGYLPVYLLSAALSIAFAWRARPALTQPLPRMQWFTLCVISGYGLMYLAFALAPETQPDAMGYHLRLVSEYARAHAFTNRVAFFDVLPQGIQVLFVPAFSVGGAVAAKLVHFTFLIATIPLVREVAREAGAPARAGSVAAALFFLAPVCGIAGTAAYTDAGLVCAACSALYFLIRWDRQRQSALLTCAALHAGFCYAIKPTFGWVAIAGLFFVVMRARQTVSTLSYAGVVMLVVLPWALRAYLLTGSPVAPFLNAWFPSTVSTSDIESQLASAFSAFRTGFSWRSAFFDYTISGGNQGLLGPSFLLLPFGLLALSKRAGRWLVTASLILAVPLLANSGTRFLMPALATASIALASALPNPVGLALVALQALGSAPPVMDLYDRRHEWRLGKVPFDAALGLIPERAYLSRAVPGFAVVGMVTAGAKPGAKIFACAPLPDFYVPREILTYWHSVEAQRFTDALRFAHASQGSPAALLSWRWSKSAYRSLRVTARSNMRIVESGFAHGPSPIQSWRLFKPGESVSLPALPGVGGADLLIWPDASSVGNIEALSVSNGWTTLPSHAETCERKIDLRRDATSWIRRSGYDYILIPVENDGFARIGTDMMRHAEDWGVEATGRSSNLWLFRIVPDLF